MKKGNRRKRPSHRLRRFWVCVMAVALGVLLCLPSAAAEAGAQVSLTAPDVADREAANYAQVPVSANGKTLSMNARLVGGVTYVPLRSFFELLYPQAKVTYQSSSQTAKVSAKGLAVSASADSRVLYANGRCFYTDSPIVILSDGKMYVPVRPLAKTLTLAVGWHHATRSVTLSGTATPLQDSSVYDETALYWLSRIISAESRGEPLIGQIAVGNVVLNRMRSKEFPNTVKEVVFDRKYGVQFSPVADGSVYMTPTAQSVTAAKICLEGYTLSEEILYFYAPGMIPTCWAAQNRPYAFTIGGHKFYR